MVMSVCVFVYVWIDSLYCIHCLMCFTAVISSYSFHRFLLLSKAFYPVEKEDLVIHPGNILASRTYYDTTNEDLRVHFG